MIVTVLGLGLMGGSLGLALRRASPSATVFGCTRSETRGAMALERGAIDQFFADPVEAVRDADVVVCCAPILSIPEQLRAVLPGLKPGALVTDVGSTKADVQRHCTDLLAGREALFIGSHPIAGSEQQGIEAAREDLYRGAMVVITPDVATASEKVAMLRGLWESVGSCVVAMTPEEHDRVLAATSHLPHMVAALLAATLGQPGRRADLPRFCGAGYRDTTRIASGGVDIWMDIARTNRAALCGELKAFAAVLSRFIEKLDHESFSDIEEILREGKTAREAFVHYGNNANSEE